MNEVRLYATFLPPQWTALGGNIPVKIPALGGMTISALIKELKKEKDPV